jgi:hypothetical protein
MLKIPVPKELARRWSRFALGAAVALGGVAALPATAAASHSQVAIIQDGTDLTNPGAAMQAFRQLGANTVRVIVPWAAIAPSPNSTKKPKFTATDPNGYAAVNWAPYDNIVRAAQQYGLAVDFTVTGGAPRWAEGSKYLGNPGESLTFLAWQPNAADYGQFVQAVGTRYDGHFTPKGQSSPLPAVHFWAIYNEPNFGEDLGPQGSNDSTVASGPAMFRGLLNAGWSALQKTGHAHDTILWGEFAAEGFEPGPYPKSTGGLPGWYGQTRPLLFLRDLYCVNSRFQELRGSAAKAIGCPTTSAASRRFRSQNPALFNATGVSDHPYPVNETPASNAGNKVDFARFNDLGNLEGELDHLTKLYGSGKHFPIYNTEYGYITNPPQAKHKPSYVSPATAATYINWAEYLSWKQSRVASYDQYLLADPPPGLQAYSGFASGLETYAGKPKPGYDAFRLPVWMPSTSFSHTASEELWGDARPAPFMVKDGHGPQSVAVQLNGKTIQTVSLTSTSNGYFDLHLKFPSSGTVRLAYTYPSSDPLLPVNDLGQTVYSRSFTIKVH